MLSWSSSNKFTRGKNERVPQNLDDPKSGQTLELGWALGNLPYIGFLNILISAYGLGGGIKSPLANHYLVFYKSNSIFF